MMASAKSADDIGIRRQGPPIWAEVSPLDIHSVSYSTAMDHGSERGL